MIFGKNKSALRQELIHALQLLIQVLPLIILGMTISAAIAALLPAALVMEFVGTEAGFLGIFIGSLAGTMIPGEPFFSLPLAEGLYKAGAGYGALVAFIASWSLFSLTLYPVEIAFLGWRFALLRTVFNLFIPPLAGLMAYLMA